MQTLPESHRVERVGDFLIRRVIGEGGMGIVYEATERLSGRRVALKVLHSSLTRNPDARVRFFNEMKILAGLEHPNIVRSLSSAEIDGKLVMALEYLEGRTLRDELAKHGAMAPARVLSIAKAVAEALVAAHEQEPAVVHRDLKPENLMLLEGGGLKVMDFGVAKVLSQDGPGLTQGTQAIGTVQYMSPEQAEGRSVTPQTDLYSLGLVLYEMLSGRPPFESPSLMGLLRHQCETTPSPLPESVRRTIPGALDALVFRLLEKSPGRRPRDARAVLAELETIALPSKPTARTIAAAATMPSAQPPVQPPPAVPTKADTIALLDRFERRRRWPLVVGIAGLTAIALAIALFVAFGRGSTKSPSESKKSSFVEATPPSAAVPTPSAPSQPDPCEGKELCAPFTPPNPASIEAETIIDDAVRFAVSKEPQAVLNRVAFTKSIGTGGTIDLSREHAYAMMSFTIPTGEMTVRMEATHMRAFKRSPARADTALPARKCTFKQIYEAAIAKGFSFNAESNVTLDTPLREPDKIKWSLLTDHATAQVDGTTCTARIIGK